MGVLNKIILPIDFETSQEFARLVGVCGGDEDKAVARYARLFSRCGYAAREGGAPGFIAQQDEGLFKARVGIDLKVLTETGLLITKEGGWFCPAFASLNASVDTKEKKGGLARAYDSRVRKGLGSLDQDVLIIPAQVLVDSAGNPLSKEMCKRVRTLVLCCDSALDKMDRPLWQFSAILVQNALRVLARYTDPQIDCICRQVRMKKEHPFLAGITTEAILAPVGDGSQDRALFDDILDKVGAQ